MVVVRRTCKAQRSDGSACRAAPRLDTGFCPMHDPANAEAAAEARRLGGMRRKREATLQGAYDFEGLTSVEMIRRLLEIAALDTLGLDNSVGRARTLIAAALAAAKLLETGEMEERMKTLEAAVLKRGAAESSVFDQAEQAANARWEVTE